MASLSQGAPPRQNEKEKSSVLDLGLDVLDLEGNGSWGMITANQIKKIGLKFEFYVKKIKTMVQEDAI